MLLFLTGCFLFTDELHDARRGELAAADQAIDADGDGWSPLEGDCNDSNPDMNPSAAEACNDVDDDCNGVPDDGIEWNFWFLDSDGDGWGDDDSSLSACAAPAESWVLVGDDCDDDEAGVNPGATEVCDDGVDNDCDAARECGWLGDVDLEVEQNGRLLGEELQQNLGWMMTSLGDVDADGVDDFASFGWSQSESTLYILRGGMAGDRSASSASLAFGAADSLLYAAGYSRELEAYLVADIAHDSYRGGIHAYPLATSGSQDPSSATPYLEGELEGDLFGQQLSVTDNVDDSGVEVLVIAATRGSTGAANGGSVSLLDTSGAELGALSGEFSEEGFGASVHVASDLDGDGLDDLAIGGAGADTTYGYALSVFLSPTRGTRPRSDAVAHYAGAEGDTLALGCVASLDLTGDGHNDLVMGAPRSDFGRVYVVPGPFPNGDASGIHPGDAVDRIAIDEGEVPYFGQSVTTGDFDADGAADLVIGSPYHYNTQQSGGAILLYGPIDAGRTIAYDDISNSRVVHATFEALPGEGARVGYEVLGLSANGDEYTDLLVNAPSGNVGGIDEAGVTWLILGDGI